LNIAIYIILYLFITCYNHPFIDDLPAVINNFAGGTTTLLAIMPCSSSKKDWFRKALLGGRPAAGVHQ
jgi:hypothetical protein